MHVSDRDPASEITSSVVLTPDRLRHGDMSSITNRQGIKDVEFICFSIDISVPQNTWAAYSPS